MKLNLPRFGNLPSADTTDNSTALAAIELTQRDRGVFDAAIPILLPSPGDNPLSAMTRLTVSTNVEKSKGGVVRLMVKASMPYLAVYGTLGQNEVSNGQFDPARSGREITVHTVITVPKALAEDLRDGRHGRSGVMVASSQLACVREIATLLVGQISGLMGATPCPFAVKNAAEAPLLPLIVPPSNEPPTGGLANGLVASTPGVSSSISGYDGTPGLNLTKCGSDTASASSPLMRALLGLDPIDNNGTYGFKPVPGVLGL